MMHARSPYIIFREIAAFLSVTLLLIPGRMLAQGYCELMPPCDSVVVDEGQGHRSVTLIPLVMPPEKAVFRPDTIIHRKQFITLDGIIKEQARIEHRWETRKGSVPTRTLSSYTPGSIPILESVSPSGGRIYSIPIATASGWDLAPNISLVYNSQGGNNVAGYGWGISGLSSITVRNSTLYYDDVAESNPYNSLWTKYALDGVPIVQSQMGVVGYSYCTARGNVLIQINYNQTGRAVSFKALYPDGSSAIFGYPNSTEPHTTYPITSLTDINGNTISFSYNYLCNTYYVTSIDYGNNASINFGYAERNDTCAYKYANSCVYTDHLRKLLTTITSRDGSSVICHYTLTHEELDGVNLLKEIHCTSGLTSELPPLVFTYGIDSESGITSPAFSPVDNNFFYSYYTKSSDLSLICSRGQLIPGNQNNCVIILPRYNNYAKIDQQFSWQHLHTYHKYGSAYNANQPIYCNFLGETNNIQKTILAGEGFQRIEAVDVDGDGVDELVKINSWSSTADVTTYKITIYSFDTNADYTSSDFTVTVNDGTHNPLFNNPAQSYYYFGNFRGDGKSMLLIVTRHSSRFALVDLNAQTKLSETSLFTLDADELFPDNPILVADFENVGKQYLCHITGSDMKVYGMSGVTSTSLSFSNSFPGISKSQLYTDESIVQNGIPYSETAGLFVLDINGDGYLDIAAAPGWSKNINGNPINSSKWNIARFNGTQFTIETTSLFIHNTNDSIVFLDIDKDGLPDLLQQSGYNLNYVPNRNGKFETPYYSAYIGSDTLFDIVPADYSLFGTKGELLIDYGPFIKVLELNIDHSARRGLDTMTDSFGILHTNTYRDLNGSSGVYLTDLSRSYSSADGFSRRCLPLNVLYSSLTYNGQDKIASEHYTYWDAVYNHKGLGFCGFGKIAVRDSVNVTFTTTVLNPEKFGVAEQVYTAKTYNGTPFSTVVNTYDNHSTTYGKLNPRLTGSVSTDALTGIETKTSYTYGDYDFPTIITNKRRIGTGPYQTEKLKRTYQHGVTSSLYVLGSVIQESLIKDGDGDSDMSWEEKTVITYDSCYRPLTSKKYVGKNGYETLPVRPPLHPLDSLRLFPEIPDPDNPVTFIEYEADNLVSETHWQYDSHGHVISETTAPYGATEYTGNAYTYDSNGRYLLTSTDALGHTTTYSGYNKFGKPATVTDYRGRVTTYTYDSWGNVVGVSYPDGSAEQTTVAWGGDGLYTVTSTATGQPETVTHYDALGREIRSGVKRFNGQWQWVKRVYDEKGLLKRVSLPYRSSSDSYWNRYYYDEYNRPDSLHYASGKWSTWSYNGTSVTTLKDGITSTRTTDASGNVVSVTDAGGTITYTLRDDGQPSSITAPGNVSTTFAYDDYGRRTRIVDPSAGTQTDEYLWNNNGTSRVTHTNPNGTVKTYRDKFGRITLIERPGEYNTTYTYDTYGRLSAETSTNGTGKEYTYDGYDRVIYAKESVPDNKWLEKEYTYGAGGVLSSIEYTSQAGYITTETYSYANGHNTGITLPGGAVVWSLTTENELGQPTRIATGTITRDYGYDDFGFPEYRDMDNSGLQEFTYSFSPRTGNLIERADISHDTSESFSYDNLNRLTSIDSRQITYAANGNILSMDGVGTMAYTATGRPYQITSLTPASGGLVQGRQQNVSYTSYNRPSLLTEGGRSATFTYNGDGERVKMNVADSTGNVLTRYYIGGRYECDLTTSGTKERLYLGGDAYSAPMVYQRENNGTWTLYNIGRDYLGSITHIATADGTLVAEYSYDPWGRLRNPSTLQIYAAGSEPELFLGRGYTGHEHLTWFGLINMNARLYDPLLGRFLSPDPYVQAPDFTQNFNRYSYALNNPLRYSDESGEFVFTSLLAPIGLAPLGVIIDGACWGALINGLSYSASVAFSRGGFVNWDNNAFYRSIISGAVSGAIFSAIGLMAPQYDVVSTSLIENCEVYLRRSINAGLSSAISAGGGAVVSDYLDDGSINNDSSSYFRIMGIAGLTAGLSSLGSSLYKYYTWDRLSVDEKIVRLRQEFHVKIVHDPNAEEGLYGYFDTNKPSQISITDKALASRSVARSTIAHELRHFKDFREVLLYRYNNGLEMPTNVEYQMLTERNAYSTELLNANKYHISMKEWLVVANGAYCYHAPLSSYYVFSLPLILRNLYVL